MMTLGDIPDLLVDLAADEIEANLGHGITATPHEAAASILNAAIKIGLVVRRIPDADDPRVLRRALQLATAGMFDFDRHSLTTVDPDYWIDQARRELESEESRTRELEK